MLVVRARDDYSAIEAVDANGSRPTLVPEGSGTWLGTTLKFTISEARVARPGNAAMLGRLTELMFVEIIREYMHRLPSNQGGWLGGVNDAHVGKALRLLHSNPVRDWTVDDLAREVAVSRSVLAQRFTELVGEAPMRYLANWRMQLAKQLMREGRGNIQEDRDPRRIRFRGRLQSRVQAGDGFAAGGVAPRRPQLVPWRWGGGLGRRSDPPSRAAVFVEQSFFPRSKRAACLTRVSDGQCYCDK